jgi:2-iminobutanoate/2-iminopropanoate deaminase
MSRVQIQSDGAPAASGAYSQAILANGFLFSAGMGPVDAATGARVGATIEEQTDKVMSNLRSVLAAADLDFSDVVKVTVHLQELDRDFAGFDATYRTQVIEPFPVRTTVGSDLGDILVEIDLVAAQRQ